jgi:adenylate cyclase
MAALVGHLRAFFLPERGHLRPGPYGVVAAAGIALGLALVTTGPLQRLEWAAYDAFMRRAAENVPAPGIVVVAIDEPSFAEIGLPWPWPRAMHAQLIDQIAAQRPASIGIDIIFDVPGTQPDGDAELAAAIARAGNVVLGADLAEIQDRAYALTQWSEPLPTLAAGAAAIGVVRIPQDPDRALRRARLEIEGRPSMAAALAGRGGVALPADPSRPRLVRFNGASRQGIATVSYYQALGAESMLPAGVFSGKHVLIGRSLSATSIDEQADHFATPVSMQMPGVEVHATILDAILRHRFVADPFGAWLPFALLCAVLAVVVAICTYRLEPWLASVAWVGLSMLLAGASVLALGRLNVRVPVASAVVVMGACYAVTAAYRFTLTSSERRMIRRAFKHYVAPAIVDQMLADPSKLKLGGEAYEVTVLFSDLEGFTTLSEHLGPEALRLHLTGYFRDMLDRLLAERATLDKLIGDAIMVYFGCPIPDPAHPVQACRAALAMQRRMVELNADWAARGLPQLRTRIGINTGRAVAGNMGTDTIFNYTIIGDCVNLASRLEGVNKEYGTLTIAGEDTWSRVAGRFDGRELDWIRVKGKRRPVAIYEVAGEAGEIDRRRTEVFARYAEGLAAYRAGSWADAGGAFGAALAIDPSDGPSRTMIARCDHYAMSPLTTDWDGVHVMTSK